ncbi:MAG: hypothetical protein BV456_01660 [Thermoplasmata archaeon M8B2D]|nr:MAG: hypothetical protein BV456_01660 [Thermoplasmata archaeon M8B2D]
MNNNLLYLEKRGRLVIEKLKETSLGNLHKKNNYIYYIDSTLYRLLKELPPIIWVDITGEKHIGDINYLRNIIIEAEKYLESIARKM